VIGQLATDAAAAGPESEDTVELVVITVMEDDIANAGNLICDVLVILSCLLRFTLQ
jgi:hypothetical protein